MVIYVHYTTSQNNQIALERIQQNGWSDCRVAFQKGTQTFDAILIVG